MLHVVCDCGALIQAPPGATGTLTMACRACGRTKDVPDPASLGLEVAAAPPPRRPAAPAPAPIPVPMPSHAPPSPVSFGNDERLDLKELDRHAARLQALSAIAWLAGVLATAGSALFSSRSPAERAVLACGCLFATLLVTAALRAARAAALASLVLAERQREIARHLSQG